MPVNPQTAEQIAAKLTEAQRLTLLALTTEPQFASRETFNARSAEGLCWVPYGLYAAQGWELARRVYFDGRRPQFVLTPLGLEVRRILSPSCVEEGKQ